MDMNLISVLENNLAKRGSAFVSRSETFDLRVPPPRCKIVTLSSCGSLTEQHAKPLTFFFFFLSSWHTEQTTKKRRKREHRHQSHGSLFTPSLTSPLHTHTHQSQWPSVGAPLDSLLYHLDSIGLWQDYQLGRVRNHRSFKGPAIHTKKTEP